MNETQRKIWNSFITLGAAGSRTVLNEDGIVVITVLSVDECREFLEKEKRGEIIPDSITIMKDEEYMAHLEKLPQ